MVISITSQKGGVGKSTLTYLLATFFARDKYQVCIADSDDNQTCLYWSNQRVDSSDKLAEIPVFAAPDEYLVNTLKQLRRQYDVVLVDGKPTLGRVNSKLLHHSDYVLIPLLASGPDASTLDQFTHRIRSVEDDRGEKLHTGIVINRFDAKLRADRVMRQMIADHELGVYTHTLASRTIYKESYWHGKGFGELFDEKGRLQNVLAHDEFEQVYQELLTNLHKLPRQLTQILRKHQDHE